jgi:hypothetical protein
LGARPPNWYLVFAFSGPGDAEAKTDPANPHTGLSVPANSSGRVSLDRYQDLEIDLRECSITKQKRVAGPRDRSSEAAELHNQWVNEGEGEGQGGSWRHSDAGQGATRHFENASTVGL